MKKMNKKGAEMTIGTLVVIILVLVVLVVVLFGFSSGWSNLWGKVTGIFFPTKENVQNIIDGCKVSCSSGSEYDYCNKARILKFEDSSNKNTLVSISVTCLDLQTNVDKLIPAISPKGYGDVKIPSTGVECSDIQCTTP
jgi:hypothetical protein